MLFTAVDKLAADGDFEKHFQTPEVKAAEAEVHAYDLDNCGWKKVDSTAVEYAFEGIPSTVEAGVTSFELRNTGKELHELSVIKKKDGVTESFDEILKLDQEEGQKKVDRVAGAFRAARRGRLRRGRARRRRVRGRVLHPGGRDGAGTPAAGKGP